MISRALSILFAGLLIVPAWSVTFSTVQLSDDGSNLYNMGVQVAGGDVGGDAQSVVVNGVDFGIGGFTDSFGGDIDDRNTASTYFSSGNADLSAVMNDIKFTGGVALPGVTFSGLNVGQTYTAQFLSWDAEVEGEGNPGIDKELRHTVITSTVDSDVHFQEQIVVNDGSMVDDIFPIVTTAEFVANDATVTFNFALDPDRTFDDNAILNGVTLWTVPEPTSAVLALLGLVGLICRRR